MKIADTSFNKSKVLYQKSLNNSGFYENIIYQQDNRNKNQLKKIKKRQLKIIWLNPPFSKIMKTNIGKKFFKLIKSHFSKHKMLKTFNKNTVAAEIWAQSLLPTIEELFNQLLITMDAIVETELNVHLIINV